MKSFKFRYSIAVWVLLGLLIALATAGLIWNIYNIIAFWGNDWLKVATFTAICALALVLIVFGVSVAVYGRYVVKGGTLISYFGLLKTKYDIEDIVEITHFKKSNKLVTYFTDQTFTVIVIDQSEYTDFVMAIREVNPKITYDTQIDGEDTPE